MAGGQEDTGHLLPVASVLGAVIWVVVFAWCWVHLGIVWSVLVCVWGLSFPVLAVMLGFDALSHRASSAGARADASHVETTPLPAPAPPEHLGPLRSPRSTIAR